ncbi:hypothetical protein IMSAGC019_02541 [Lachnospiraceae bacterium]|nr:hypothetical protein IMSAGC019_02541 [Lachnospiraceae bacterium]
MGICIHGCQHRREVVNMTVNKILEMGLVNDSTEIFIRDEESGVLAHGNWYQDDILVYGGCEVKSFTWQDDNKFYIDVKMAG